MMFRFLLVFTLLNSASVRANELSLLEFIQLVQSESFEGQLNSNQAILTDLNYQQQLEALQYTLSPNIDFARQSGRKSSTLGFRFQQPVNSTISTFINSDYKQEESSNGDQTYTTKVDLGLSVSLIRTFSNAYRNKAKITANLNRQVASLAQQQRDRSLYLTAYSSFVQHQQLQELYRLAQEATSRSEKNYASANARFLMGQVAKSDVFRAQTALNQAKLNQSSYYNSLLSSQLELNQLANREVSVKQAPEVALYGFRKPAFPLESVPEVEAVALAVKVASQSLKEAEQEALPDLIFTTKYQWQQKTGAANLSNPEISIDTEHDEVNFGISVENSFNARSRNSDWQRAQIELKNAKLELKIKERQVLNQIDVLKRDIRWQKELAESYRQTISLAEAALTLLNRRYEKGLISNIEVLDSEAELVRAKTNYRSAVTAHNLAVINFYYFIGQLNTNVITQLEG